MVRRKNTDVVVRKEEKGKVGLRCLKDGWNYCKGRLRKCPVDYKACPQYLLWIDCFKEVKDGKAQATIQKATGGNKRTYGEICAGRENQRSEKMTKQNNTTSSNDDWIKKQKWVIKGLPIPETTHQELLNKSIKEYKFMWQQLGGE